MDPASATGLIAAIAQIITQIYSYGQSINRASNEVAQLRSELFALKAALEHLTWNGDIEIRADNAPPQLVGSDESNRMLLEAKLTLESLLHTLQAPKQKTLQKLESLVWPFKAKDVLTYVSSLERIKTYFVLLMTSDNLSLNRQVYNEVLLVRQDLQKWQDVQASQSGNEHRQRLKKYLSPCDPAPIRQSAIEKTQNQSGQWFLGSTFVDWVYSPLQFPPILWLHGKPGSGKTTLMSLAVTQLLNEKSTSEVLTNVGIAYFYCSLADQASQELRNILGSFAIQLCDTKEELWAHYDEKHPGTDQRVTLEIAMLTLNVAAKAFSRIVLFIDGLNESTEGVAIADMICQMCDRLRNVTVAVSSTDDFMTMVSSSTHEKLFPLAMDIGRVQQDISVFIASFINNTDHLKRLPSPVKKEISDTLLAKARGSFQWVRCQLEAVSSAKSLKDVRTTISNVPQSLEDMYIRVLASVPTEDRQYVKRILLWLTFSFAPLRIEELSIAAVFDGSMNDLDPDSVLFFPERVLSSCRTLIRYDPGLKRYSISHSSVYEFLTSEKLKYSNHSYFYLDPSASLAAVARYCVAYLSLPEFSKGFDKSRNLRQDKLDYPLYEYAATRWSQYARRILVVTADEDFKLHEDSPAKNEHTSWVCCVCRCERQSFLKSSCASCEHLQCAKCGGAPLPPMQAPASLAANIPRRMQHAQDDRSSVLEAIMTFFATADRKNRGNFGYWFQSVFPRGVAKIWNSPPLYTAAREGLGPVVEALLKKEGSKHLETPGGRLASTPLHVACYYSHTDVVKILLDAGANPYESNNIGESGLQFAKRLQNSDIVEMLVKARDDRRGSSRGTDIDDR